MSGECHTAITDESFELLRKLDKDLKEAAKLMGRASARYFVDAYYAIQGFRIRSESQVRIAGEDAEPHSLLSWIYDQTRVLENNIRRALNVFALEYTVGKWLQSITGIGPVISAGLLAHIDITKAPTVGHIWRFAGLDPTTKWEKSSKRPWNAELKTLAAFKAGESFVKVQANSKDYYGKLYVHRKEIEANKNLAGQFADQAQHALEAKRFRKDTAAYEAYSKGLLPQGHIHARARRWCVKLFLAHVHEVMYLDYYERQPPKPWIFEFDGNGTHKHLLKPPNWPWVGEMGKSLREMVE